MTRRMKALLQVLLLPHLVLALQMLPPPSAGPERSPAPPATILACRAHPAIGAHRKDEDDELEQHKQSRAETKEAREQSPA